MEVWIHARRSFEEQGYWRQRRLFSPDECSGLRDHFMRLRAAGTYPGDFVGVDPTSSDPLRRYPRMIHMHRWDEPSRNWLLSPRLNRVMTALLGAEPLAVQTMLYFKPPGARGQALHQDQHYLLAEPGTCLAAWLALDDADEENGCLRVVPGSHRWPLLCVQPADVQTSFTDVEVPLPPGAEATPVAMEAGDVLFFHGHLVHGSLPNRSEVRFRRALIGHYITGDARRVAAFYHPVLRMDGSVLEMDEAHRGGPCGRWVEADGGWSEIRHPAGTGPEKGSMV